MKSCISFRLVDVAQLTIAFTLIEFMQRSCSDTITFKKTVSSTLNLHFQIFICRSASRR